ncbi:MAG: preprotein translocase subunit SecG [Bacilli bacterium]|nr:preprotein translocase subunit SecG [Bacilli bacterium]
MQWYDYIFLVIALIIIVLSLLQGGKSEGASGAITGGGLNVFAKTKERGSERVITWLTFGFAIVFFFLAILISAIQPAPEPKPDPDQPTQLAMAITTLINVL